MKKGLSILSTMVIFGLTTVGAHAMPTDHHQSAYDRAHRNVEQVLIDNNIDYDTAVINFHERRTGSRQGFKAYVELDDGGSLVVDVTPNGLIRNVYTKYGADMEGITAW